MSGRGRGWLCLCLMVMLGVLGSTSAHGAALLEGENVMRNQGYMREYVSMNLQDIPETLDDDQYALNMVRTQVLLETDLDVTNFANVHSRLRAAKEYETEYLDNLQTPAEVGSAGAADLTEEYETFVGENDLEIRELYLNLDLTRSTSLRLGKQLVSWGKGSFERALDLVTGFNGTWGPLVTDEEERRKSLIMANLQMELPARDASIEVFYQPGYDDIEDIGNSNDNFGGRNTLNGLRGLDLTEPFPAGPFTLQPVPPTNPNHVNGGVEDEKFGLRWRGLAFNNLIEYSLAYLRTHQKSGVEHTSANPYKSSTTTVGCESPTTTIETILDAGGTGPCLRSGEFHETIFPIIDVYGGSFNYYSQTFDVVVRGELAYLKDRVFAQSPFANQSPAFTGAGGPANRAALMQLTDGGASVTDPIEKDEYRMMLGFDRNAYFARDWFFADRPGRMTIEFFDFLIDDYRDSEFLADSTHALNRTAVAPAGSVPVAGTGLKEHTLEAVASLDWSYASGTYGLGQTAIIDMSYGGNWTYIPSFTYQPTTNWIVKFTGIFVFEDVNDGTEATSFGAFGDSDRLTTQVTYQF